MMNSNQKSNMQITLSGEAKARVDARFARVSIEGKINSMLYLAALLRESQIEDGPNFSVDMRLDIPNAVELLEMKNKVSLLPLETVDQRVKLPALPGTILRLQRALDDKESAEVLAAIIAPDPKLTTAILSLVNSSLNSLQSKVETLSRAVAIVGTKEISSLALGARMLSMFEENLPPGLPVHIYYKHSIATATIAHSMAVFLGRDEPEKYFVAGLLHDMGRVILFSSYPDLAQVVMALHKEKGMALHEAEELAFDADHCMIGGLFFGKWSMPRSVVNSALYHHDPSMCAEREVEGVIYAANQVATAVGIGCNQKYLMNEGDKVWDSLGLGAQELFQILEGLDERLLVLYAAIF